MLKILKPEEYIICFTPLEAEKPECPWYNGGAIFRNINDKHDHQVVAYSTSPEDNEELNNYRNKIDSFGSNDLTSDDYYYKKYHIEYGKGWFWLSLDIIRKEREQEDKIGDEIQDE